MAIRIGPEGAIGEKAAAIGALVYLVSPLDAEPDVIPVAGLVDDVAVILSVVKMLADALKQHTVEVAEAKALVSIKSSCCAPPSGLSLRGFTEHENGSPDSTNYTQWFCSTPSSRGFTPR